MHYLVASLAVSLAAFAIGIAAVLPAFTVTLP